MNTGAVEREEMRLWERPAANSEDGRTRANVLSQSVDDATRFRGYEILRFECSKVTIRGSLSVTRGGLEMK